MVSLFLMMFAFFVCSNGLMRQMPPELYHSTSVLEASYDSTSVLEPSYDSAPLLASFS